MALRKTRRSNRSNKLTARKNRFPSTPRKFAPLKIVYLAIGSLHPDPRNPRIHSKEQIRKLVAIIRAMGFNVPLLINARGQIIAGHCRWLAAQELGMEAVPTILLEHLTEAQARAFLIADNRLTEIATWDDQLLGEQLKLLSEADLDFDLEVIGFDTPQIDLLIEGLGVSTSGTLDPADAVPEISERPPVSRPGDQWNLGRHALRCGDARVEENFAHLMGKERAAVIFADSPYNVPIAGHASGLGSIKHADFAMACGEMSGPQFKEFLSHIFRLLAAYSKDGALHYLTCDWRHLEEFLAAGGMAYTELKHVSIWVKTNSGMGSFYRNSYEVVLIFKHGKGRHCNNIQLGKFGRHRSDVWTYPSPNSFAGRRTDEGNPLEWHATPKPVGLVADVLLDASARGDCVLDCFLGSGSTLIAAERTGRRCFGMELDPKFVDVAIRRWQAFTGDRARHAASGRVFDDIAAQLSQKGGRHGK